MKIAYRITKHFTIHMIFFESFFHEVLELLSSFGVFLENFGISNRKMNFLKQFDEYQNLRNKHESKLSESVLTSPKTAIF